MDTVALSRDLSKLIAAIEREWREELGGPDAAMTEAVLKKVHRLLTMLQQNGGNTGLEGLQIQLGKAWLELHPWASPYVQRIDTALASMNENS